jgi:tetratricopeptide (TPR) repeat protein
MRPLVEAMAIFARQLGNEGQAGRGLQLVQALEAWTPGQPVLLGTRVQLLRQRSLQGYLTSLPDLLELTRARLLNERQRWAWLDQHLAWFRLAATFLLWGWTLVLAARYRRIFRDLWDEPMRRHRVHGLIAALGGALLLSLPVLLGLGPELGAMFWLWLMVPLLLPREVRLTFVLLFLQLVHPAMVLLEPLVGRAPEVGIVALQQQPRPLPVDPRILAALPPADRDFLAGWRQLESQQWPQAEATFERLAETHPDRGAALNNLGVAQFQLGHLQAAQATFDKAAGLLPGKVEVLLNQSVVAFRLMDSALGTAKQDEASRASRPDYERLLAANQSREGQRTFPIPMPDTPERTLACSAGQGTPALQGDPGQRNAGLAFNLILPFLAAAALAMRLRRSLSQAHPSQCSRCGDPFHTTDSPELSICSKCHHLFILKDGLHAESRKRKVDEVAAFQKSQRWLYRCLQALLPGAARCFRGDTWRGCAELALFCGALGMVLTTGRAFRYPGEVLADPASIGLSLGLALLGVLYLRSWSKLLARRS